ncbi:MAG: beta-N-acetylhexosaminidase [Firmicutes bacterium HGW-Firmicutes-7]|nr:MAG: beta-N-acetylhexosaminidase [Firmicutes bacterium HGW-Firmicutes-7]
MKKICLLIIAVLILTGCMTSNEPSEEAISEVINEINDLEKKKTIDERAEEIVNAMSLEEKVAQLFVIDLYTYNNKVEVTQLSEELESKLVAFPVGGVIYFSGNIVNRDQLIRLTEDLQRISEIPLFISIDEEGGKVSRLGHNSEMGMTPIPSALTIGNSLEVHNAYQIGRILGRELNALGFNIDFAPVADVNTNKSNPVIGDRAFSDDPTIVGAMVGEEIKGLQEQGVAAVAKHFPGHGDTSLDTHKGTVYVNHDKKRLEEVELVPFLSAIDEGVKGIMVAHIALPFITKDDIPASLSKPIITDILRGEMNYKGFVITDALNMAAITDLYKADEACIKALHAGVDVLLMPEDFTLAYDGIIKAVKSGEISEERIKTSVRTIIKLKLELGLFEKNRTRQPLSIIGSKEHLDTINEINK